MGIMTEEIEALRQQRAEAPRTHATEVGARAIQNLISNGTGENALKPGEAAPFFVLPNHNGEPVSLNELLAEPFFFQPLTESQRGNHLPGRGHETATRALSTERAMQPRAFRPRGHSIFARRTMHWVWSV